MDKKNLNLSSILKKIERISLKKHTKRPRRPTKKWKIVNGKRVFKVRRNRTPSPPSTPIIPFSKLNLNFGKKTRRNLKEEKFLKESDYTIATSTIPNAGNGAFTNIFLPKGTTLAYYKGKRLTKDQYNRLRDQSYVWELSSRHGPIYIDGKNPKLSNWLRFLNDSRDRRLNVEPYQYGGNLYYRTTKNINPGSELFISYGDGYW